MTWRERSPVAVTRFSKSYGRLPALREVSCTIRPGEVLGLIGPNGAGKTTLFEGLAGVLPMDAGTIEQDGRVLTPAERRALLGYIPDGIAPWAGERVGWILDFTIGVFGSRGADPSRRRSEDRLLHRGAVIRDLSLDDLIDAPLGTLSKGQRKRALLAIGLLLPHPFLLIDEPFDGLDLRQTREIGALLRRHAAAGRTLFLSIHQIGDAARVCDRVVLLDRGRVTGEGTIEELAAIAGARGAAAGRDLEEIFLALT